jgi:hypothetical protein
MQELVYVLAPPACAFILCFLLWLALGRDPKVTGTIYPLYEPPQGLGVIETGILLDDVLNRKDLAYELYNLILQRIIEIGDDNYLYLNALPENAAYKSLSGGQQKLLDSLFSASYGRVQKPAMRLDTLSFKTSAIKDAVYDYLAAQGYYHKSPKKQRQAFYSSAFTLMTAGIVWNVAIFILLFDFHSKKPNEMNPMLHMFIPWELVLGLFLAGFIIGIFGSFMGRKTPEGVKKQLEIYGFREFIITAERDRIELVAKEVPEQYKKTLPYAFLFGVGDQWAITADDLAELSINEHLDKITADIDPETIEEAFEEKKNILFFIVNAILKSIFDGISNGTKASLSRRFDRNSEYRRIMEEDVMGKYDDYKLMALANEMPPEIKSKIVEKNLEDLDIKMNP